MCCIFMTYLYLQYSHQHLSVSHPTIFRVMFSIQEYKRIYMWHTHSIIILWSECECELILNNKIYKIAINNINITSVLNFKKSVTVLLCAPLNCHSATVCTTQLSQCYCVHHSTVTVPLCAPLNCHSATVCTTKLSQCHCVHHKTVTVLLCAPQNCHSATVCTTKHSQCYCVHHKYHTHWSGIEPGPTR